MIRTPAKQVLLLPKSGESRAIAHGVDAGIPYLIVLGLPPHRTQIVETVEGALDWGAAS